jgi:hypothetical protein
MLSRTKEGAKTGFLYGLFYAAAGIVILLIRGPRPLERFGVSAPLAIVMYLIAGILAGAVVGILSPLARSLVGKMFVGVVAMIPVSLMYIVAYEDGIGLRQALTAAFIISTILGSLGGAIFWKNRRHPS